MSNNVAVRIQGLKYRNTWSSITTYAPYDVVTYNNSFYLSLTNSNLNNVPQTSTANWALLDQGFFFRNAWSNVTTYQPYDVVTRSGNTYFGLSLNNINNDPATDGGTNWTIMAASGQVAPRHTFAFTMPSASITNVQVSSNVVTLTCTNTFQSNGYGTGQGQVNTIYISGLTNATFLNGQVLTIASITGTTITANFTHTNYGPTGEPSGVATLSIAIGGVFWATIPLGKTFAMSFVQCAQATRIELYSTNLSRSNDSSRPATTQPTQFTQHGVISDLNLDGINASFTSWVMSPLAYGANLQDGTVNIPAALTNLSGAPTTNSFSVTFTFTFEEQ